MKQTNKNILRDLNELLHTHFPGFVERIVLFGSRVNGNVHDGSDYDILIVLYKDFDWKLEDQILSVCYEIDLKYDIVTDVKLIPLKDLSTIKGRQPFVSDALEYGITA